MVEIIFPAVGTVFQPEVTKPQVSLVALGSSIIRNKAYCGFEAGKVAKKLIKILQGFDIDVLAYDLYPDLEYAKNNHFRYTDLNEIFEKSDIISLHCPLTEDTTYIINESSIAKMKPGVMLINTGRGKLIDSEALIEGLKQHKIGAAGLDVYEEEANYFYDDNSDNIIDDDKLARLLSFNNVVITSHQAFFTHEAVSNIAERTLENVQEFIDGKPLSCEVKNI